MNREIELYRKKLKAIETTLRELKYYRKALERDICKFFIKSYSNKDLNCDICLVPGGHKDVKDSNYQYYVYKNRNIIADTLANSIVKGEEITDVLMRDYIRYKSLRKSIKEVNKSIKANTELYNGLMKEYKRFKNELNNR